MNHLIDKIIGYCKIKKRALTTRKMRERFEIEDIFEASRQIKIGLSHRGKLNKILRQRKKS
jgi:hypothetical protein